MRDLTEREYEVLRALASTGASDEVLAAELGMARRTVGAHLYHLMLKADVSNRTELAIWAWRTGKVSA